MLTLTLTLTGLACGRDEDSSHAFDAARGALDIGVGALPGTLPEHRQVSTWEALWDERYDLDEPLMTATDIALSGRHQVAQGRLLDPAALTRPPDPAGLRAELDERLAYLRVRLVAGELVSRTGQPLPARLQRRFDPVESLPRLRSELRVARAPLRVRCGPLRQGLYRRPVDLRYDRNNCSTVRPGEPVQVVAAWEPGLLLVRTPYTLGWVRDDAALSSPPGDEAGASTPATPAVRPLTRRAFLREAFALLDEPYGWGGQGGGLDCSRFVKQVLGRFGLALPRSSGAQSRAGTFTIDLSAVRREERKLWLMDRAARSGIVLLHLPGHVMFYLGRDRHGQPMVIHSLAEYAARGVPREDSGLGRLGARRGGGAGGAPGAGGAADGADPADPAGRPASEVDRWVGRVCVSSLELGRDTSRRALVQRVDRLTVFGGPPDSSLAGVAQLREAVPLTEPPPRRCGEESDLALLVSPQRPHPGQPLRVVVATDRHPGPLDLALFDPAGKRVEVSRRRFGGPPHGWELRVEEPRPGTWTFLAGEGARVDACRRIAVGALASDPDASDGPLTWEVRRRWDADTEALYAVFVESLFRYRWRDAPTWRGLTPLIRNPDHNLLHDHFAVGEEREIRLEPDCADLPYVLRAYFAWKLGLPHAFRKCSRAGGDRPVRCREPRGHWAYTLVKSPARMFHHYAHQLGGRVHSSSARTRPRDAETDYYPVPLRRATLPPGTVYADPYGHTLIITRWIPQTLNRPGALVAADAQPDGTVGLRRFWRGSFLFHPRTQRVGAGWKAARPVRYHAASRRFEVPDNAALRDYVLPFSLQQYQGSTDDFYRRMQRVINPLPQDAERRLETLVVALHETVQRRVQAVALGDAWVQEQQEVVDLPHGARIFLTTGPWEKYSTPARDLRLLMAIDVVTGLIGQVRRHPRRFGIAPADRAAALRRLTERLSRELRRRTIRYVRSDGSPWVLTLDEVVSRQSALEMGYHPNDCVEIRWGAPPGSAERSTCDRRAPEKHRDRMEQYRPWFKKRTRPAM